MTLDQLAKRAGVFGLALWATMGIEVAIALAFHIALSAVLLVFFMVISLAVAALIMAMWPAK
jgi:hypothetical protein